MRRNISTNWMAIAFLMVCVSRPVWGKDSGYNLTEAENRGRFLVQDFCEEKFFKEMLPSKGITEQVRQAAIYMGPLGERAHSSSKEIGNTWDSTFSQFEKVFLDMHRIPCSPSLNVEIVLLINQMEDLAIKLKDQVTAIKLREISGKLLQNAVFLSRNAEVTAGLIAMKNLKEEK